MGASWNLNMFNFLNLFSFLTFSPGWPPLPSPADQERGAGYEEGPEVEGPPLPPQLQRGEHQQVKGWGLVAPLLQQMGRWRG